MIDPALVRARFPALASGAVFFDNPGGTQIAQPALDRMREYLEHTNANHGGAFRTSRESDAQVEAARAAAADFLGAARPEEIIFGANMTTLTFHLSRSLGRRLGPGDEIVVTQLDHDANVAPWLLMAQERQAVVRWAELRTLDCTLDMDNLARQITPRTKIVALGYASNSVGTINEVARAVEWAHAVGALCYVDAVHYAPHGPIDVGAIGCDLLVCSAYKFFGPHLGLLYGRYDLLQDLPAYKVRPAPDLPPDKFETGTGNFEAIAGLGGTIDYLEWLGSTCGQEYRESFGGMLSGRRVRLRCALSAIRAYEIELGRCLIERLQAIDGLRIYGIQEAARLDRRVPTVSFTLRGHAPRAVADYLGQAEIYAWDGNYYAPLITQRLGLEAGGGMVRVGPVHYNTRAEIERLGEALESLSRE
ncbi:MAG: cysteine desulfurase-like protein [Chloroflexi bacterium]|nr:cysteine desulfurase-like protein [Chloroflexota bacterium]